MLTRVLPENKKIGEHKRWRMKDVSQESVFIFLKKDSVVPEGWGTGFDPEARQYRVVASTLCSIWLGAIFFPVRSPWPKMSIFCLLFPVYIVCNYVSNVLQSIRMVLFRITKLNASITSSVVWHEGMRVFRGCKAWWEHKVGRWHTAEGAQLGEVSSMLPVGNSLWNKLSFDLCLVLSQGISTRDKNGNWGWTEDSVGFIHYAGVAQGRQICHHHHHQLLPYPQNYSGISWSPMGYVINSSWEYTSDWEALFHFASALFVRPCSWLAGKKMCPLFFNLHTEGA